MFGCLLATVRNRDPERRKNDRVRKLKITVYVELARRMIETAHAMIQVGDLPPGSLIHFEGLFPHQGKA